MDMVSANKGPGNGLSQLVVGTVNGEKVRRTEFEKVNSLRYSGSSTNVYQNRNSLWDWYVEDYLLKGEAEVLGLGVSPAEITELEFGDNLSPVIRRNFPNPQQPGAINREQLNYFKQIIEGNTLQDEVAAGRLNASFPDFWRMQRDMIVKERLQAKVQALVQKAMYTPTWMAEMGYNEQNQTVDFAYVKISYDQIANEEVSLSDSDLSSYLNANEARFKRKTEQRVLDYVVFDVVPTAADSTELRNKISSLKAEFATTDSDSNFVIRNEGIITPTYSSKADLSTAIADTVMALPAGSVYGPYIEMGEYRLVKVIDKAVMADSADTRHILLSANTTDEFAKANERADSMINVLRAGTAVFDTLVVKFSQDPGSVSNGGKYENVTPNQFVPEFNKVLFITGQIGQLYKVRTSYGIHIVEVLKRSANTTPRVMVAYLRDPIVPSKDTQDNTFQLASQFVGANRDLEDMIKAAGEATDLRVVSTPALDKNSYELGPLGFSNDTKDAICWAFTASPGEVSPTVYTFTDQQRYYDNKYVILGLKQVLAAGVPSVADVREELEAEVMNIKKTELLSGKITGTDLVTMAGQFGVQVDTITNAAFDRPSMPGLGNEARVIATAVGMTQGQTSKPIQGEGGVFVVQLTRKAAIGQATNLPQIRQRMSRTAQGMVASYFMTALKESAKVDDNRTTFECN